MFISQWRPPEFLVPFRAPLLPSLPRSEFNTRAFGNGTCRGNVETIYQLVDTRDKVCFNTPLSQPLKLATGEVHELHEVAIVGNDFLRDLINVLLLALELATMKSSTCTLSIILTFEGLRLSLDLNVYESPQY